MSEPAGYCPFVVGDRVVCVDAGRTTLSGEVEISEGEVYTVRWIGFVEPIGADLDGAYRDETLGVRLVETNRPDQWFPDYPLAASRFRPAPVDEVVG